MKMKNYYIFWGAITVAVVVPQIVATTGAERNHFV